VVAYLDSTIALPIITSYALGSRKPRPLKRLYDRREELISNLKREYARAQKKRSRKK
jgi:deoxyhypusine synthase